MQKPVPWRRVVVVAGFLLCALSLRAAGHGDSPPTLSIQPLETDHFYPPRWSWLHWWEANRDPYLVIKRQIGGVQKPDVNVEQTRKAAVIAGLQEGLKSPAPNIRGWSALALGQMADPTNHAALAGLMLSEQDNTVHCMGLLGLGLLDSPEAEKTVTSATYPDEPLELAALASLGLHANPDAASIEGLQRMLSRPEIGPATMAAWALEHQNADAAKPLYDLLMRTDNQWLASSAILALGRQRRPEAIPVLAGILLYTGDGQRLPAVAWLWQQNSKLEWLLRTNPAQNAQAMAAYNQQVEAYKQSVAAAKAVDPNFVPQPVAPITTLAPIKIVLGYEITALCQLRASAAIALGNFKEPAARQALMTAITTPEVPPWNGYTDLYKGMAIMSLGQIADRDGATLLVNILQRQNRSGLKPKNELNSPLRAYAAMALGLYCRPADDENSPERAGYSEICRVLGERFADPQETDEVRSASAMALGLTTRTENLKYLQAGFNGLGSNAELIGAYALLARGMLGDQTIITPARNLLSRDQDKPDMSGVLARRAAVLGLSLLQSEEVVPILRKAWDLNYYVNREVAFSFACLRLTSVADEMVREMKTNPGIPERAYFARCLGELYTTPRPARLALFSNGSNYTIKNLKMISAQGLANEFLYNYLIPSFGDQWR